MRKKGYKSKYNLVISIITLILIIFIGYYENKYGTDVDGNQNVQVSESIQKSFNLDDIPEFDGKTPYVIINNNEPNFPEEDFNSNSFEKYSELDSLGRCGVAYANVSKVTMPTEDRGEISKVKPTGWHTVKYDCVEGKYLYNRCHLIGYQLTAENANKQNLITGTRYLNVDGMLPFENQVAEYVKQENGHVLYRVTPIFKENNLVANGVQMEAESVEDKGEKVKFNVYAFNVQPNIKIDYLTGNSELIE
ncbi:MAG: DNA/RNA non-specific endonuclease [Clostridia bacterium]